MSCAVLLCADVCRAVLTCGLQARRAVCHTQLVAVLDHAGCWVAGDSSTAGAGQGVGAVATQEALILTSCSSSSRR